MFRVNKIFIAIFLVFFSNTGLVFGYVSESSSYKIQKDSINFSGTDFSSSTNYLLSDTLGELATGDSVGVLYALLAGYRATGADYTISISAPENVSLSPNLETSGGSAEGSGSWTVTTDNPGGYLLYVKSVNSPSLQSSTASFSDYSPEVSGTPDFSWGVGSDNSEFGFTVSGGDEVLLFKDNGLSCGIGSSNDEDSCWYGFSTGDFLIASKNSNNNPGGSATTIKFKAEIGSEKNQTQGNYSADIILTALVQ